MKKDEEAEESEDQSDDLAEESDKAEPPLLESDSDSLNPNAHEDFFTQIEPELDVFGGLAGRSTALMSSSQLKKSKGEKSKIQKVQHD